MIKFCYILPELRCGWHLFHFNTNWGSRRPPSLSYLNLKFSIFSRAVLCSLTGNILGLKSRGGWCADDAWTTCGWHESETLLEISAGGWHVLSRTSSAHRPQAGMSSACHLQAHMSSTHHLQNSSWSAWTWTIFLLWQGTGYWMEFVATMLSCFISGSCKWFAT